MRSEAPTKKETSGGLGYTVLCAPCSPQHHSQRKPLTDEQIDEIWQSRLIWSQRDIARAIEQAHGIGAKND